MAFPLLLLRHTTPRRLTLLSTTAVLTTSILLAPTPPTRLLLRADASPSSLSDATRNYRSSAKTPIVTADGAWNPAALKQLSAGSVCGLLGGVAVGVFSKPLALVLGLLVFGVQALQSSLGISLLPYNRIQRMFGNVNVKSLVLDHAAFKLAFGATFALAAFAEF